MVLVNTGSELPLIPRDPQSHCGLPVKAETYGGQVINEGLAQNHLTVSSVRSQTHTAAIFPGNRMCNWNRPDILSNWQNPYTGDSSLYLLTI